MGTGPICGPPRTADRADTTTTTTTTTPPQLPPLALPLPPPDVPDAVAAVAPAPDGGAAPPPGEEDRVGFLCGLGVLDTPPDPRFDDITKLVRMGGKGGGERGGEEGRTSPFMCRHGVYPPPSPPPPTPPPPRQLCTIFSVPIAIASLVDAERQWFKSICGLGATETDRRSSFCAWTLLPAHPEVLVVPDAPRDARFAANPLVTGDPGIRFYAGEGWGGRV